MKLVALLALVLGVAIATYSAAAWSAPAATPTELKLQKDVRALKAQVAKLQKADKTQNTAINTIGDIALSDLIYSACVTAVTADAVQGTWQIVDQIAAATQAGKTYFGAQTPVSDSVTGLNQTACQTANVSRSQTLPPTSAQFTALLGNFQSALLRYNRLQRR